MPPEPNGYLHLGHKEIVSWLGFEPVRITSASDNFDRLYDLAEELIRKDGAYVCHCSKADIKLQRADGANDTRSSIRLPCSHRSRPIDESLSEFRAMRDGKFMPSEASLRMKQDLDNPNPQIYGRLNLTGTILSKRKIQELVQNKHVRGWDDPRLYTLVALRRRGVPPGAILAFVNELVVTKAKTNIQTVRLEQGIRRYLESVVPRLMLVLEPLKIVIQNLQEEYEEMVEAPFSRDPAAGSHHVPFTRTIYIERSDFREEDSSGYFRLAPGKSSLVCMLGTRSHGKVSVLTCNYIHWVGQNASKSSPIKAEIRVYHELFKSEDLSAHPDGFLADLSSEAEQVFPEAMLEIRFEEVRLRAPWPKEAREANISSEDRLESIRFQGMRIGYFCVDKDSTSAKLVLNQITGLKDSSGRS
ncbi:hypothetical protein MMC14_006794 [Varicellaria rhodocarpa]|nr:hypothetical protein [Varicellaria rhodocarpa]